jgi:hypothetical protein
MNTHQSRDRELVHTSKYGVGIYDSLAFGSIFKKFISVNESEILLCYIEINNDLSAHFGGI